MHGIELLSEYVESNAAYEVITGIAAEMRHFYGRGSLLAILGVRHAIEVRHSSRTSDTPWLIHPTNGGSACLYMAPFCDNTMVGHG